MARSRRSLQDLIKGRQQSGFVGRRAQVVQYQENLRLPVEDERRRFLFNIHGDAGVGKTYLTKQLRQIADDCGALTAYTDETVDDVMSAMTAIVSEFRRYGTPFAEFEKRVAVYRARRQELESDPDTPEGVASFLTKAAVMIGIQAARDVPIAGNILAPLDARAAAEQVNRARVYLARKFADHADVRLLLSPADELTPIFVSGLNHVTEGRPISLFFDTYERTAPFLDPWLRHLYAGRYGELPITLISTISGQNPLNPNLWGEYLSVITDIPLEPFSEAEARQFLVSKNISDERTVQVILTLSGRLPMWLATLAEASPDDPADIGDPAGDAVGRFLKWEDDPTRRAVAVTAALPRTLNRDVLEAIASSDDVAGLFNWLCSLPFVTRQASSWRYHEVVRSAMLRLKRAQSPNEWRVNHVTLAQANAKWAVTAVGTDNTWTNPDWINYTCEEIYHWLCADPIKTLPRALEFAVKAAEQSAVRARQWAELIADAGRDSGNAELQEWGRLLQDGIHEEDLTLYLSCLIQNGHLDDATMSVALEERGEAHRLNARYTEALADFDRAIELNPKRAWAIASRGKTYEAMGRYDEALADFDRAIELNPRRAWFVASRGEIYRLIGRFDDALADFDRAIELDPEYAWAIASRGQAYEAMGRHDEALADFDRAIELDPEFAWAVAYRGEIYRRMGRFDDALADFDHAIELDPENAGAMASRGQVYEAMGRDDDALADFDRAIELNPKYDWAMAQRGQIYQAMGRYTEALADFDRAIELNPKYGWAMEQRQETREAMGRYTDDLPDLNRVIEADPSNASAIFRRGRIRLMLADYDEGIVDLRRAIELNANVCDDLADSLTAVAADHLKNGRPEVAAAIFKAIVSVIPNDAIAHNNYGFCLLPLDTAAALVELEMASRLGYDNLTNLANRVLALHLLGRNEESLSLEATGDAQSAIRSVNALMWLIQHNHILQLSNWIDTRYYLKSLLIHIEMECN
jgi:tetratricopeptide (TPR) repeat protein